MKWIFSILIILSLFSCRKNGRRNCPMPGDCETIGLVKVLDTNMTPVQSTKVILENMGNRELELESFTNGNGVATFALEHQRGGVWSITMKIKVPDYDIVEGNDYIQLYEEQTEEVELIVQ